MRPEPGAGYPRYKLLSGAALNTTCVIFSQVGTRARLARRTQNDGSNKHDRCNKQAPLPFYFA